MGQFSDIWFKQIEKINRENGDHLGTLDYEKKKELKEVIREWEEAGYISQEHPYPKIETIEDMRRLEGLIKLWKDIQKEYKDLLMVFSLTRKCENWCDFCSFDSNSSNNNKLNPEDLIKIDRRMFDKVGEVQFSGGGDPLAYEYEVNGQNAGILAPFIILYDKGVRKFSILTSGIPVDKINNKKYVEPILLLREWLNEHKDVVLKLHISFHLHHIKYKEDPMKHLLHYAKTIDIFKDFPNLKIHLKFMVNPYTQEEERMILEKMFEFLPQLINGLEWEQDDKRSYAYLTNGSMKIIRSGMLYLISYNLSKRRQRDIPVPFTLIEQKPLACEIFKYDTVIVDEQGWIKGCPDYRDKLEPAGNVFQDEYELYFDKLEKNRAKRVKFLKENFAKMIHEDYYPQYCQL